MRWFIISLILFCSYPVQADTLKVLTTTMDLKSIAEMIGGDRVKVESLGQGDQNYHFLAAKPSYMIKANKADLFIVIGLELEVGYEPLIREGARNPKIQKGRLGYLDASEGITPLEIRSKVDRSMGDIHAGGNPHYWLDPLNAKTIAVSIAERLSALSADDESYFQENLNTFHERIDQKMKEWQQAMSPYKGEKIISYHLTWSYLAHRFGLDIVGQLEPKPGVPPSPGHLKRLIEQVQHEGVKVILNENIYRDDAARFVAEKTGAIVVNAPVSVGGVNEAKDYFGLIDYIVEQLLKGFGS